MHGDTGGKDQREGSKSSTHGKCGKVNQELDMKSMCHTKHNEAPKIFIVLSGKDTVA